MCNSHMWLVGPISDSPHLDSKSPGISFLSLWYILKPLGLCFSPLACSMPLPRSQLPSLASWFPIMAAWMVLPMMLHLTFCPSAWYCTSLWAREACRKDMWAGRKQLASLMLCLVSQPLAETGNIRSQENKPAVIKAEDSTASCNAWVVFFFPLLFQVLLVGLRFKLTRDRSTRENQI